MAILACFIAGVTSCSVIENKRNVAAIALADPTVVCRLTTENPVNPDGGCHDQYDVAWALATDSQTKCAAFTDDMQKMGARENTALDIAGTTFSAFATVFTRVGIKNALSAGSTIATGARTDIGNEYFNAQSIAHVVQAIKASYSTNMANYMVSLQSADKSQIRVKEEQAKIWTIHSQCSLASADAQIAAALTPSTPTPPTEAPLTFSYTVTLSTGDANNSITLARNFASAFNATTTLSSKGISGTAGSIHNDGTMTFVYDAAKVKAVAWKKPSITTTAVDGAGHIKTPGVSVDLKNDVLTFSGSPAVDDSILISLDTITAPDGSKPAAAHQPVPFRPATTGTKIQNP